MKFTMFVCENFPQSVKDINDWLAVKEEGAARVPKLVNTNICNTQPSPMHGLPLHGLPLVQVTQVIVMTIFYELEWPEELTA